MDLVLYIVFGVLTVAVNTAAYYFLRKFFSIVVSSLLAWFVAVVFAYATNHYFVFKSKAFDSKEVSIEFLFFLFARIVSEVIELILLPAMLSIPFFAQYEVFVKIIVNFIVVVINYIASKYFIF